MKMKQKLLALNRLEQIEYKLAEFELKELQIHSHKRI